VGRSRNGEPEKEHRRGREVSDSEWWEPQTNVPVWVAVGGGDDL